MRRLTAYHEAGHAVAFLKLGFRIDHVSIRPSGDANGYVRLEHSDRDVLCDYRKAHREIIGTFAGYAAEVYFLPEVSHPGFSTADFEQIERLVLFHHYSESRQERIQRILYGCAMAFVERHRIAIAAVAQALMQSVTIDHRSVKKIIRRVESDNGSLVTGAPW